jgi:hypothetical protein
LSAERLSSYVTFANRYSKLAGLIAHESSHFLETSEPEADWIQDLGEISVSKQTIQKMREFSLTLAEWAQGLVKGWTEVRDNPEVLGQRGFPLSHRIYSVLTSVQDDHMAFGFRLLDAHDNCKLMVMLVELGLLEEYAETEPYRQGRSDGEIFAGRDSMSLLEWQQRENDRRIPNEVMEPYILHRIERGDSQAAKVQIDEMLKLATQIKSKAEKIKSDFVR